MAESTWPPRWTGPQFKEPIAKKVTRGLKRRAAKNAEDEQMRAARRRDKYCRFPLCGCKAFALRLEVAHLHHRGIGGNPKLDRTTPDILMLVCSARHKENRMSLDRGTIRWQPLTDQGADGPVAWAVDVAAFNGRPTVKHARWVEVAREVAPHVYLPFHEDQRRILEQLKAMLL